MKHIIVGIMLIVFALISNAQTAEPAKEQRTLLPITVEASSLHSQTTDEALQRVSDQLSEVRRDELNYRLEKDLLEKAYGSNLQIANGVIAAALAFFSLVGFFGMRDIHAQRREYMAELEKLQSLRADLEAKLSDMLRSKEELGRGMKDIEKASATNELRIKVLELQEKANALLFQQLNPVRALEYVAVGLDIDPHNAVLLWQKGTAQWRLGQLVPALATYKELLEIDPNNLGNGANALELAVLAGDESFFENCTKGILQI